MFERHSLEVLPSDPTAGIPSNSASVSASGAPTNQPTIDSSSLLTPGAAPAEAVPQGSVEALKKYVAHEMEEHDARVGAHSLAPEAGSLSSCTSAAAEEEERGFQTRVTAAFEQLLLRAGRSDVALWLQYARFLLRASQSSAVNFAGSTLVGSLTERYSGLYWRALKALDAPLVQTFVEQYTLLRLKR